MDHKELARMGGYAVLKKYGKDHFKRMRKAVKPKSLAVGNPKKPNKTEVIPPIDTASSQA